VRFEGSTKPHVHRKYEIFWTNIASTMACPNFKNGPKNGLGPLGVNLQNICLLNHVLIMEGYTSLIGVGLVKVNEICMSYNRESFSRIIIINSLRPLKPILGFRNFWQVLMV
jgi:hypothetical protein